MKDVFTKKLDVPMGITFDDVLLLPNESRVEPDKADVKSRVSRNILINLPLVSAAMDTVTEANMAIAMAREGGMGVIHRNMSKEKQINEVHEVKRADELLVRDVLTATPDYSVKAVWRLMTEEEVGAVPIVDKKLVGIVSRRDILPLVESDPTKEVKDVMTKDLITAYEGVSLEGALDKMYEHKVERLPVVDEKGNLKGIIAMQNILQRRQYPLASRDESDHLMVAAAVGPFDVERAIALDKAGANVLMIDCAHAHNMNVVDSARIIKKNVNADVVVGNIATADAAEELVDFVDGVKVGVGPGSICITRLVAGVGVPQLTAIAEVADITHKHDIPLIADGGIRYSGDVAKAIAIGADVLMLGNLLAGTDEAPGRMVTIKGRRYKQYRGMGSLGAMSSGESTDRYLSKTKFVPEGVEGAIPYSGTVGEMLYQLVGGLRSAMGYIGAQNVEEMHKKSRFVRITPAGYYEGHPHDVLITDETPNYPLGD
ncbi:MAG: IMP dehydrogenase [Methanocellales archaeon]|nr:IMP dehydrogenase [Methanocellales archaeon]MDD3292086.1 IMP dehydrogenase [Methanocellales archaeon]MDD5235533.1 IMP dehydrogenase [Methanocellales archaeon]MDD5485557.1 IMP dehydrogenase [Methanocellales archaeon]